MFLSVCVSVSLGRRVVPWTIVDIQREDRTFRTLFTELKAEKFDCVEVVDELKRAILLQVLAGKDKDTLMVTSGSQLVFNVCEEFGKYVKEKNATSFSPSQQHINNVGLLLQCEECDKWRLMFCKHKLSVQEISDLQTILDDISYTCGTTFDDLELPGRLVNVFVKDHS